MSQIITAESVTEGHPDKVCDQVSDAVLDAALAQDPMSRVAIEALATTGVIHVAGEMTTRADLNIQGIVRDTLRKIDYSNDPNFNPEACGVFVSIDEQSPEIADGVSESLEVRSGEATDRYDTIGAGDQGIMFGFATNETPEFMPAPIAISHALAKRLSWARKELGLKIILPDGKTQTSVVYKQGKPAWIDTVLISTQHSKQADPKDLEAVIRNQVIGPVLLAYGYDLPTKTLVNPSGSFVLGGPQADTGLTGRKIIADTYGGAAHHGGGAFSGKDPTKVDRSAAYALRWAAKNAVAAGLADKIEIQLAYAIGKARPVGIYVDTFGTGKYLDHVIQRAIEATFDFRPQAIIESLELRKPIYSQTAAYGHFGKAELPWEQLNKVDDLQRNTK
jgi:S-adenosylmethionine synthetase